MLHALGWSYEIDAAALEQPLTTTEQKAVEALVARRIKERCPAAYLTGRMWFAGLEFEVDKNVLVPRSPIAELIEARFAPWVEAGRVSRILDIGTGSGCIAIAMAQAFPNARVDATDVSAAALAVAQRNVARYELANRVVLLEADLFPSAPATYDLIVSNPPYVPRGRMPELPAEYRAEPALGLVAGEDGFECLDRILATAGDYLADHGVLVVEVGEIWPEVEARYAALALDWVEFSAGGEGVFVLETGALRR